MVLAKKHEIDMTEGTIFKKMVLFAVPLIITNLLQTLFTLADTLVLGAFADQGNLCVGAVSTTAAIINLVIALFIGLSAGANVMVARYIGARRAENVKRTIGLSVCLSVVAGGMLVLVGAIMSRTFLIWTGCGKEFIDLATRYLTIYLCGAPFMMLYNFSASVIRASGDTVRPMAYIMIGGVVNVILNIVLVVFTPLDIEGVAIATVISNAIAGICCLVTLIKSSSDVKFEWKYFRFYKEELLEILKVGVPSGIQGAIFAFSNVLVTASINRLGVIFGKHIVSGSGYATQLDNLVYVGMNAVALATQAFVSQNLGARKPDRIKRTILIGTTMAFVTGQALGIIMILICKPVIFAISQDWLVAEAAFVKCFFIGFFYSLCGIMDTLSYSLRGLGKSMLGMLIALFGSILLRIIWIFTIFEIFTTETGLYSVYPISWIVTDIVLIIAVINEYKKINKTLFLQEKMSNTLQQDK